MRITVTMNLEEGKPYNARLLDVLFSIAQKLNAKVVTSGKPKGGASVRS